MSRPRFTTKVLDQLNAVAGMMPEGSRSNPSFVRAFDFLRAMSSHVRAHGSVTKPKPKTVSARRRTSAKKLVKKRKRRTLIPDWQVLVR